MSTFNYSLRKNLIESYCIAKIFQISKDVNCQICTETNWKFRISQFFLKIDKQNFALENLYHRKFLFFSGRNWSESKLAQNFLFLVRDFNSIRHPNNLFLFAFPVLKHKFSLNLIKSLGKGRFVFTFYLILEFSWKYFRSTKNQLKAYPFVYIIASSTESKYQFRKCLIYFKSFCEGSCAIIETAREINTKNFNIFSKKSMNVMEHEKHHNDSTMPFIIIQDLDKLILLIETINVNIFYRFVNQKTHRTIIFSNQKEKKLYIKNKFSSTLMWYWRHDIDSFFVHKKLKIFKNSIQKLNNVIKIIKKQDKNLLIFIKTHERLVILFRIIKLVIKKEFISLKRIISIDYKKTKYFSLSEKNFDVILTSSFSVVKKQNAKFSDLMLYDIVSFCSFFTKTNFELKLSNKFQTIIFLLLLSDMHLYKEIIQS